TAETSIDVLPQIGIARRQLPVKQRTHQDDPAARRVVLVLQREIRRTRLQTEPAVHTRVESRLFLRERRVSAWRPGRLRHDLGSMIPGFRTWCGSKRCMSAAESRS